MRAIPTNDFVDRVYDDVIQFGNLLGMDLKFPYTVESLCKELGMEEVQTVVTDSLETPEIIAKTRAVACSWYLDCLNDLVPMYMPILKGLRKEEALVKRDELIKSLKRIYAGGVTPGMTMVRIVAKKR